MDELHRPTSELYVDEHAKETARYHFLLLNIHVSLRIFSQVRKMYRYRRKVFDFWAEIIDVNSVLYNKTKDGL